jgi:hypothetical protein
MRTRDKIAFVIYFLVFLTTIVFGVIYLFSPTIMPYHKEAINMKWEDLGTGLQVLLQGFMKLTSAGFFVTGLSGMILLLIPFRHGEKWARWAVPSIGFVWNIFCLYVTSTVAMKTGASTPWPGLLIAMIMMLVAFMLSPSFGKDFKVGQ